jgi:hypothetical protein
MIAMTDRRLPAATQASTLTGLILFSFGVVTLTRLLPYWLGTDHPLQGYLWNFTPLTALILFGVALFPRRWVGVGFLLPILAMLGSDLILHLSYPEAPMNRFRSRALIYGTFLLIGCLAFWLRYRRGVWDVVGVSLTSSLLFFLITNFAVWVGADPKLPPPEGYEKTVRGLVECYSWALPFLRNAIVGDLFYCGLLFGGYALVERLAQDKLVPVKVEG